MNIQIHSKRKSGHKIAIAIPTLILVVITLAITVFRKPLAIYCHKQGLNRAQQKITEIGPIGKQETLLGIRDQSYWIDQHDHHRDALVRLGYFEKRIWNLHYITVPSLQSRRLWEELSAVFPDHSTAIMQGYEEGTADTVIVWDRPENLFKWDQTISAHDSLSCNTLEADDKVIQSILGQWGTQEEPFTYRIAQTNTGIKIITPPNEMWQIELRNLCIHNGILCFDQFFYTDPKDNLKTFANSSGDHSYSGIRSRIEMQPDPLNPNALHLKITTIFSIEQYTLFKMESEFD
ncbi:MAG: hypothetical protein JW828_03280 [Sedimentisphaerales bacterium]|nr:hypothetical protein [Sedimentisphaerales bacterium]